VSDDSTFTSATDTIIKSTAKYYPEFVGISNTSPEQYEWVDLTLRVHQSNTSTSN
jgi:hypothetical protein